MLSPIRMQLTADLGFRHWKLAHPLHTPYSASLTFNTFTHLWLLPHIPSRASQRLASLWSSRGSPQQRTCLVGVGFPLPRPQVWTFTSCSLFMPSTTGEQAHLMVQANGVELTIRCRALCRRRWRAGAATGCTTIARTTTGNGDEGKGADERPLWGWH